MFRNFIPGVGAMALASLCLCTNASAQLPSDDHWMFEFGGPDGEAYALEKTPGYIYIGGGFLSLEGDANKKNLARFNLCTEQFEQLPGIDSGFTNFVRALYYDRVSNSLFVGGDFTSIGGVGASKIARFDLAAETWHILEDPTLGPSDRFGPTGGGVYAIVRSGNYLYIGGKLPFTAPNDRTRYIRRFNLNTNRWVAVGEGVDLGVFALDVGPGGEVYAGGNFENTGDAATQLRSLAKWSGGSWSEVGGGISTANEDAVRALRVNPAGELAIGGQFTAVGGNAASDVAIFSGGNWNTLAGGVTGGGSVNGIYGLDWASNGDLYIGGDFDNAAAGGTLNKCGMWNGSWNALGSGLSLSSTQIVNAVLCRESSAFFTGVFSTGYAAPNDKKNFAEWEPDYDFTGYPPGLRGADRLAERTGVISKSGLEVLYSFETKVGFNYELFISEDGGASWVDISDPFVGFGGTLEWTIDLFASDALLLFRNEITETP